jgi:hypothetical protein
MSILSKYYEYKTIANAFKNVTCSLPLTIHDWSIKPASARRLMLGQPHHAVRNYTLLNARHHITIRHFRDMFTQFLLTKGLYLLTAITKYRSDGFKNHFIITDVIRCHCDCIQWFELSQMGSWCDDGISRTNVKFMVYTWFKYNELAFRWYRINLPCIQKMPL